MDSRPDLTAQRDVRQMFAGEWPAGFTKDPEAHRWVQTRDNETRYGPTFEPEMDLRIAAWRYHLISKYGVVPPGYSVDRGGKNGRYRWRTAYFSNDVDSGEEASDQAWSHFTSYVESIDAGKAYEAELRGRDRSDKRETAGTLAAMVMELAAIELAMSRLERQKRLLQEKIVQLSGGQEMIEALAKKAVW